MTHMYQSSKGPVAIDTMPLTYAKNAKQKLERDPEQRHRTAEIGWLDLHIRKLEAEGDVLPPTNHNAPPEEAQAAMSWEAIREHMDNLLLEAMNWADGTALTTQAQADEAAKLRQALQDAVKLADEARVEEKRPHDDAVKAIQDRYNAYIAPVKNKTPGSVSKAVQALGNLLTQWLNKQAEEKAERERAANAEAERLRREAIEARKALTETTDLAMADEAAALLDAAEEAQREARRIENEKVQVHGGSRAKGLRTVWKAVMQEKGGGKAMVHYANTYPGRVKAFLQELADQDVKSGIRQIPGFDVVSEGKI